ncbi:hypothetical protein C5167_048059 [Papaver somniferum]|uniref:Uncharacterized protein n=1 Tax=Papaver somniferum TaxID=3469 RepID=A0A4Y7KKG4_PAPSO|nr:hypothetical protein C5167_048059 [Papaver somniferum]
MEDVLNTNRSDSYRELLRSTMDVGKGSHGDSMELARFQVFKLRCVS